jgi:hypothetical protein
VGELIRVFSEPFFENEPKGEQRKECRLEGRKEDEIREK